MKILRIKQKERGLLFEQWPLNCCWVWIVSSDSSSCTEVPEVEHERDNRHADQCAQSETHHQHHISLEVTLKREGDLDEEVDDEHLESQPFGVLGLDDLCQLREHCPNIDKTSQPNDERPANLLRNFVSRHWIFLRFLGFGLQMCYLTSEKSIAYMGLYVKPNKKSASLLFLVSNLMTSRIKNFSFLLSVKTWFEPIVFPGSLAVLKSCGEAARNFLGKNAFGLIQEYCTIEEIASFCTRP